MSINITFRGQCKSRRLRGARSLDVHLASTIKGPDEPGDDPNPQDHAHQHPRATRPAAKQEVANVVTLSHCRFSIYPPVQGRECSLRWAEKKFEEMPIAHIKASYNTQITGNLCR